MSRADVIIAAAVAAIEAGHVLHVRAERRPGSRRLRTPALAAVDMTAGPNGHDGFLLVDYSRDRAGLEDTAPAAEVVRLVRRALTWDRVEALSAALAAVYGPGGSDRGRFVQDAQDVASGRRMRLLAESRPVLRGPLFY